MIKKRNPFLLFLASLIPGAGEMYLGFFRQGLSIMTVCAVVFAIGDLRLCRSLFSWSRLSGFTAFSIPTT